MRKASRILRAFASVVAMAGAAFALSTVPGCSGNPDDGAIARSAADAPEIDGVVRIARPGKKLQAGDWADVQVTGADAYDLQAKIART